MMVVVVVMMRIFAINQALDGAKLLHVARDGEGTFLIEPIFFFSLLQQVHEERVIEIDDRDHKPLLLLSLTHQHSQAAFGDVLRIHVLLLVMGKGKGKMEVRHVHVKMKIDLHISTNPHDMFKKKSCGL